MATNGEIIYIKLVAALAEKVSTRFITGRETQKIGRYFWPLLNDECVQKQKQDHGKDAFWQFALQLKSCLVNNDLNSINALYTSFNQNAINYFENLYDNCMKTLVNHIL